MADTTPAPQLTVRGQYIKDLSFESPRGPFGLNGLKTQPNMQINVDLEGRKLSDDLFELTLKVSATAKAEEESLFLIELAYGGMFQLENVPEERQQPMLLIDCAFILFPFARRVIADITRDGGFPPLMLEPIDFHSLYVRRIQELQKQAAAS